MAVSDVFSNIFLNLDFRWASFRLLLLCNWGDPNNEVFTSLFVRRPLSAHSSDHKNFSWHCPCRSSDIQPGANTLGSILYSGANPKQCLHFRAKHFKASIGTTRSDVGRRTRAMSGEVFYGQTVRRSEGSRAAKGIVGRRTVGSFYFFLEPPS